MNKVDHVAVILEVLVEIVAVEVGGDNDFVSSAVSITDLTKNLLEHVVFPNGEVIMVY